MEGAKEGGGEGTTTERWEDGRIKERECGGGVRKRASEEKRGKNKCKNE